MDTISQNSDTDRKKDPLESCIAQMLAEVPSDSRHIIPKGNIEELASSLWNWSQSTDGAAVRIRPSDGASTELLGHCILEAVGPDRPFLVDSLLGACGDLGLEVLTLFHPIVELETGPLSLIQIHLPDLSQAEQDRLLEEAVATLNDVIMATSDYQDMRRRMREEIERLTDCTHVSPRYKDEAIEFLKWLGEERFVFLGARTYRFQTGCCAMIDETC